MSLRVPSHLSHSVFPVIVTAGNPDLAPSLQRRVQVGEPGFCLVGEELNTHQLTLMHKPVLNTCIGSPVHGLCL